MIGIPDEVAGEVPVAVIKASQNAAASPTDVQKCVLDRLGRAYALEKVLPLEDLGMDDWPKTTSGKILKTDLRKMALGYMNQEGEQINQINQVNGDKGNKRSRPLRLSQDELHDYLLEQVQASGIPISTIDDDFHNAGMDSLLAMQLRNAVVMKVGLGADVPLSQNVIFEAGNVRNLAAQLKSLDSEADHLIDDTKQMTALVDRYCRFRRYTRHGDDLPKMHTIVRNLVLPLTPDLADSSDSYSRVRQARLVLTFLHN